MNSKVNNNNLLLENELKENEKEKRFIDDELSEKTLSETDLIINQNSENNIIIKKMSDKRLSIRRLSEKDPKEIESLLKDDAANYTAEDLMELAGTTGWRNYLIVWLVMAGMLRLSITRNETL